MTVVKTAISIQKTLYEQAELLAKKMNISRSHLFGMAVEDFIQRYQNRSLLEEINQAYSDEPDPAEQARLLQMRKQHRKIVEGEW
jgi:metal-responsive CopG/Arc/MetJ family transcriptional regulator